MQDLEIQLSSRRSLREIVFKDDPVFKSVMNMSRFSGHQEWKLTDRIKIIPSSFVDSDIMKKTRDIRSSVTIFFKLKRHSWYFVWNVIVFIVSDIVDLLESLPSKTSLSSVIGVFPSRFVYMSKYG